MTAFKKFRLIDRTKNPTDEWSKKIGKRNIRIVSDDEIKKSNCNWGIACGVISDLTVVDLDSYEDDFNFPFDYLNIDTRIIETPNGGHHLYFKYEPDLYTVASKINVDVRNSNGYVVDANSIGYSKVYDEMRP